MLCFAFADAREKEIEGDNVADRGGPGGPGQARLGLGQTKDGMVGLAGRRGREAREQGIITCTYRQDGWRQ